MLFLQRVVNTAKYEYHDTQAETFAQGLASAAGQPIHSTLRYPDVQSNLKLRLKCKVSGLGYSSVIATIRRNIGNGCCPWPNASVPMASTPKSTSTFKGRP